MQFVFSKYITLLLVLVTLQVRAQKPKRVLLISSYNSSFPTFFSQIKGVQSGLDSLSIKIDIESLDSKRFPDSTNFRLFDRLLYHKLQLSNPYCLVLVADDNAFRYALSQQNTLFKGLPIVFFGVNNIDLALQQNNNAQITGVVEASSFKETLEVMARLFPTNKEIYAISDKTTSGINDLELYLSFASHFPGFKFKYVSLAEHSFASFAAELQQIHPKSPVLLLSAYHSHTNETKIFEESMHLINANLQSPLFHLWQHGIENRIIGGKLISHFEQGKAAAQIATRIMAGQKPSSIPVVNQSPNQYIFNYTQLQKHGISLDQLPRNYKLVNYPNSFWRIYNSEIITFSIFAFALIALTIGMFVSSLYRRKAERELRKQNNEYEKLTQILQNEKRRAEASDELKTAFLNNISHEFRTPMNGILGFSELLKIAKTTEKQKRYLHEIQKCSNKLLHIVTDTVEVSQVQSNQVVFDKTEFDFHQLLHEVAQSIEQAHEHSCLDFQTDIQLQSTPIVSDRNKCSRILSHLLDNAFKFTHQGQVVFSAWRKNEEIIIQVQDTGIGIAPDKQEVIFKPYMQVERKEARSYGGNGLGLAIVKSHLTLLGGKIHLESELGVGTTVLCHIPIQAKTES